VNPRDAATNRAAVFHPMRTDDERPAIEVAGAFVFAYIRNGVLRVSIDLDTADTLAHGPAQLVPVTVTVQGQVVYAVDGSGRDLTPLAGMDPTRPIDPDPPTGRGFTVIGRWDGPQPTVTSVHDGDLTAELPADPNQWAVWVDTAFEAAAEQAALERLRAGTNSANHDINHDTEDDTDDDTDDGDEAE
jgi:hypothetical protein